MTWTWTSCSAGANNTLYLYAPASEQERLRPLFELLVSVVIFKAEQLAAAQPDGMLDPRLFVCLDEAGNCAAIKKLPQLATTGRGQGIQLLTIWHDEAQLQHRYGHRASTVLNGHRAKLLLVARPTRPPSSWPASWSGTRPSPRPRRRPAGTAGRR